jgi:hypothetical protein
MVPADALMKRYGSYSMYNCCSNCERFLFNDCKLRGIKARPEEDCFEIARPGEDCFVIPPIPLGELVEWRKT